MNQAHRKSSQNILFHLFVLTLAIVIDLPWLSGIHIWGDLGYYLLSRIFLLIQFYICYFWLVPSYLARKKTFLFSLILICLIAVVAFAGIITLEIAHGIQVGEPFHFHYNLRMQLSAMFAVMVASAFGIIFRIITSWYDEIQKRAQLEEEKLRSELMLLKAQVNPHFLFNTLNNIDSLIASNQAKASESLIKLSGLMRYVIYEAVNETVPLEKEIEYLKAYIDLQSLRYADNSAIRLEITGNAGNITIAPMLFIPFIENSFKHSGAAGIRQGLIIKLIIKEKEIEFFCQNHIALSEKPIEKGGFGLQNIQKRLTLQYPDKHELTIDQTKDRYLVLLKIKMI
jgi:sensor histidine kinase YesM